jgi:flagellar motor switch protein FliN/FliY
LSHMQDSGIKVNDKSAGFSVDEQSAPSGKDSMLLEHEADVIGEVGNMSMGAAATVLSELLERKVTITAPAVEYTTLEQVKLKYPIPCIAVSIEYSKGIVGTSVLVMKEEDALAIAQQMIRNSLGDVEVTGLDDLALSALGECMNQMMGASATSLARFIRHEIDISPPKIERVDLRDDIDSVRDLVGVTSVVQTVFRMFIDGLVESDVLQLMHIEFAKTLSNKLLDAISDMLTSPQEEVKGVPDEYQVKSEQNMQSDGCVVHKGTVDPGLYGRTGDRSKTKRAVDRDSSVVNIDLIKALPVEIKVVLGQTRTPLSELISLGRGAIIELDTHDQELVDIRVNDCLIAKGEVVVVNEQYGVRIVEIVDTRERLMSLRQE